MSPRACKDRHNCNQILIHYIGEFEEVEIMHSNQQHNTVLKTAQTYSRICSVAITVVTTTCACPAETPYISRTYVAQQLLIFFSNSPLHSKMRLRHTAVCMQHSRAIIKFRVVHTISQNSYVSNLVPIARTQETYLLHMKLTYILCTPVTLHSSHDAPNLIPKRDLFTLCALQSFHWDSVESGKSRVCYHSCRAKTYFVRSTLLTASDNRSQPHSSTLSPTTCGSAALRTTVLSSISASTCR